MQSESNFRSEEKKQSSPRRLQIAAFRISRSFLKSNDFAFVDLFQKIKTVFVKVVFVVSVYKLANAVCKRSSLAHSVVSSFLIVSK